MSDTAFHQPSPAKRGRGRGRGGSGRGGASARARGKPAVGRRGRAKVFEHPRAQAAHERQRDLKAAYAALAASIKPALEELADRNLDKLRSNFDAHKEVDAYTEITAFLDERFQDRMSVIETEKRLNIESRAHDLEASASYTKRGYQTIVADKVDELYDTLLNRVEQLQQLFDKNEPVDKPDESYNYKSITTEQAAQQGIYRTIHNGTEVPYPQLHPELVREANKASDSATSNDPQTPTKRKAADQLDDEPIPKRPASLMIAPILPHISGMLSARAGDEPPSQQPSLSPAGSDIASDDDDDVDDEDDESSPLPDEPTAGRRGRKPQKQAATLDDTPDVEIDNDPPLPPGASEPDEHGVRIITKRARGGNDSGNNRIMIPALYEYDPLEIGFKDSTNDSSRTSGTKAKRKKYVDTPNSKHFVWDRTMNGYDVMNHTPGELCQETIEKHKLHPKYGIFLNSSVNDEEPPRPYVIGWKPTVFVTEKGKIQHTSRSIPAAKASGNGFKDKFSTALAKHMLEASVAEAELEDEEYYRLVKERDQRLFKQKSMEHAAQAKQDQEMVSSNLTTLLDAAVQSDCQKAPEASNRHLSRSGSPAVPRASSRPRGYDAVRDVQPSSVVPSMISGKAVPIDNSAANGLQLLADTAAGDIQAALVPVPTSLTGPEPHSESHLEPVPITREPPQLTIQMPEPIHPNQLRDPSELEQRGKDIVRYTSVNPFLPEALAPQLPRFTPGGPAYVVAQPPQHHQEHNAHKSPLAPPESFAYREQGYERLSRQRAESIHDYGDTEVHLDSPQRQRTAQTSQEDQYAPARPNTEDVVDPALFGNNLRPAPSGLQAPQPEIQQPQPQLGSVLQQPQNSFFQTALNSPVVSPPQQNHQQSNYPEPPQARQQFDSAVGAPPRSQPATEGALGRTPFSHPSGMHRGTLVAPAPLHLSLAGAAESRPDYPSPPPAQYQSQGYQSSGYVPSEQSTRSSSHVPQPMMHSSHQQPLPLYLQYPSSGQMGSQLPRQYEYVGPTGHIMQSPPPFGNGPGDPPSPSMRGGDNNSSSSRNKNSYREIQPAPRMTEVDDSNGQGLRINKYNPHQTIRDYPATAPPPSHGPTQIRGWTHRTSGPKTSRGKNSADSTNRTSSGQSERQ